MNLRFSKYLIYQTLVNSLIEKPTGRQKRFKDYKIKYIFSIDNPTMELMLLSSMIISLVTEFQMESLIFCVDENFEHDLDDYGLWIMELQNHVQVSFVDLDKWNPENSFQNPEESSRY